MNSRPIYRGGSWGHQDFFLGVDGQLYVHWFTGRDELDRNDQIVTTLTDRVEPIPQRDVIGHGEPFQDVRRKVDAVVLRALAG